MTTEARFWAKVDRRGVDECWPWTAYRNRDGYGRFSLGGRRQPEPAHRIAYRLMVGPIPDGLTLDHLCRNRACVNPAHLEPVTNRTNVLRGQSTAATRARQTHCKRGHLLEGPNLLTDSRGNRRCHTCYNRWSREWQRANYQRRRASIEAASPSEETR